MWNAVKSNAQFNNGYVWMQRTKSLDGGMMSYTETAYPQIPVLIMGAFSPYSRNDMGTYYHFVHNLHIYNDQLNRNK